MLRDNVKKEISPQLAACIHAPRQAGARGARRTTSGAAALAAAAADGQQPGTPGTPGGSRPSAGGEAAGGLSPHWASMLRVFDVLLATLRENHVPPFLVQKLFEQLLSFVNVQLFNQLLLRRECCSFSNGEYVKAGLSEVEQWISAAGEEWVSAVHGAAGLPRACQPVQAEMTAAWIACRCCAVLCYAVVLVAAPACLLAHSPAALPFLLWLRWASHGTRWRTSGRRSPSWSSTRSTASRSVRSPRTCAAAFRCSSCTASPPCTGTTGGSAVGWAGRRGARRCCRVVQQQTAQQLPSPRALLFPTNPLRCTTASPAVPQVQHGDGQPGGAGADEDGDAGEQQQRGQPLLPAGRRLRHPLHTRRRGAHGGRQGEWRGKRRVLDSEHSLNISGAG